MDSSILFAENYGPPLKGETYDIERQMVYVRFKDPDGRQIFGHIFCGSTPKGRDDKNKIMARMYREKDGKTTEIPYVPGATTYNGVFGLPFSRGGVLSYVNERSATRYRRILWDLSFTVIMHDGFDPYMESEKWARENKFKFAYDDKFTIWNHLGTFRYKECELNGRKAVIYLEGERQW